MKYWKASELRNWLLYYSLQLLVSNLPSLYFHHYALLVCAMHILLQIEITVAQVDAVDEMLPDFCLLLPKLYGKTRCTHNTHLLTYLTKYVCLWVDSLCFWLREHEWLIEKPISYQITNFSQADV